MPPLPEPVPSSRLVFRVPPAYEVRHLLGQGAYGVVRSALHRPSGREVAIKKIIRLEDELTCLRTLREIKLLRHFRHENIVSLFAVLEPPYSGFNEVYLVQEVMPINLQQVIQSNELTDEHCQYFVYQIFRGLKAIHSAEVVHRDLKPANLLVNDECDLKICDFGLARADVNRANHHLTAYVVTRWYRAPEVMISPKTYTKAIDLWSAGCILAEMLDSKVLFRGKDHHDQLLRIFSILGSPSMEDYYAITSRRSREFIQTLPIQGKTPWKSIYPKATNSCMDLLSRLLTFNPDKRITAEEALQHAYVEEHHDPEDEPFSELVPEEVSRPRRPLDILDIRGIDPPTST